MRLSRPTRLRPGVIPRYPVLVSRLVVLDVNQGRGARPPINRVPTALKSMYAQTKHNEPEYRLCENPCSQILINNRYSLGTVSDRPVFAQEARSTLRPFLNFRFLPLCHVVQNSLA